MPKNILYDAESRSRLKAGIDKLANAVKATLGPGGRNVVIESRFGLEPRLTKDGVTVAKEISLEDPFEDMGAQLVKSVAKKTATEAGDGTTTATVLAQAIVAAGLRQVAAGANPTELHRGINAAANDIATYVAYLAKPVESKEELISVGAISANNDEEIGRILATAIEAVTEDGVITLEESSSPNMEIEVVRGISFDTGWASPYFINEPERNRCVLDKPYILLIDYKLHSIREEVAPFLDKLLEAFDENKLSRSSLLIVADGPIESAVLQIMLAQHRGRPNIPPILQNCIVMAPEFGSRKREVLRDIAIVTGATVVSEDAVRLERAPLGVLGRAEKAEITERGTAIVGGTGSPSEIETRAKELQAQFETNPNQYDKEKLAERRGKLLGGVAKIKVGANSEAEMQAKKYLVEDAVYATKAAKKEGIVPGGGTALLRAADAVSHGHPDGDAGEGYRIVLRAVGEPARLIAANAGFSDPVEKILESENPHFGFNAATGKFEDLLEAGVIDPAKVVRAAILNAASVAGMILTTEVAISEIPVNIAPIDR